MQIQLIYIFQSTQTLLLCECTVFHLCNQNIPRASHGVRPKSMIGKPLLKGRRHIECRMSL